MSWLRVFIEAPWLAAVPAVAFGLAAHRRPRPLLRAAAGAWVVYGAYEAAMALRVFGSGAGNIRIDLFLLYPVLLALSVAATGAALGAARRAAADARSRGEADAAGPEARTDPRA